MSWLWRSSSNPAHKASPFQDDDEDEFEDAPDPASATYATRSTTIGVVPRATPEEVETDDTDGAKVGNDKDEVRSIRAPLSTVSDDEDEDDEDTNAADDFVSTAEKGDGSVSSYGSVKSLSVPVAKITAEAEDFNVPVKLGAEDGSSDSSSESGSDDSSESGGGAKTQKVDGAADVKVAQAETPSSADVKVHTTEASSSSVAASSIATAISTSTETPPCPPAAAPCPPPAPCEPCPPPAPCEPSPPPEKPCETTTTTTPPAPASTQSTSGGTSAEFSGSVSASASASASASISVSVSASAAAEIATAAAAAVAAPVVAADVVSAVSSATAASATAVSATTNKEDLMEVEMIEEGNGIYAEDDDEGSEEDDDDDVLGAGPDSLQAMVAAIEADMHKQQQGGASANGILSAAAEGGSSGGGPSLPLRGGEGGATAAGSGSGAAAGSGGFRMMTAGMQSMLEALSRAQQGPSAAGAVVEEEETEMGKKLTELRVKLFRFARRMGQNETNAVVAQVLYRLDLAERLQGVGRVGGPGRFIGSTARMDRVKALAEELEAQEGGNSPLDFEVTVMLIGKAGVGKTATIHNLLGMPFGLADAKPTKGVKLTVQTVHGVTFRMIEVPGLHPSAGNAGRNLKTLRAAKKFLGKKQPDAVLYVDRLDWTGRDLAGDLELVKPISEVFGPAIWVSTVGLLTHGSSAPPEDDQGRAMSYEIYTAHRTHAVQNTMRHAAGDVRLTNPVVLAENHPACRTSRTGDKILPNGTAWRPHVLLTCLAGRCLQDGHELLQKSGGNSGAGRPIPLRQRLPPLAFLLSNLLQKRAPVKLPIEQGMGDEDDDDMWEDEEGEEEVDFDSLPPFRRLSKAELEVLSPEQRKEYHQELAEREKLFQKKQWKEELQRRKEMRKMAEEEEKRAKGVKEGEKTKAEDVPPPQGEEDEGPSNVPVPSPEMDIPLSFDSDHPTFRYRHLPSESEWVLRPVSELNGWDHDIGFNTFQVEKSSALMNSKRIPAYFNAQVEKDKKDCAVQLEAGASVRHGAAYPGSTPVTTMSLDLQLAGKEHRMGTVRADVKFAAGKRNKVGVGCAFTKYPDMALIPGVKIEDSHHFGKRLSVVAAAGMVKHGRYAARGMSLEGQLRAADHPIGRNLHQVGLSLLDWQGDLVIGANATSQLQMGNSTMVVLRGNINNRAAGTISVRCSSSEHMQLAAVAVLPLLRYFLGGGFLFRKRVEVVEVERPWE